MPPHPSSPSSCLRWQLRSTDPQVVRELAKRQGLPEVVARVLACRGHTDAAAVSVHLEASLRQLRDPDLLPGMQAACDRLHRAVRDGERILVHGDYDVDGVTGTALLMRLFRHLGADVQWIIPNRLTDGYSFGPHSVVRAREAGARIVISVDNGTSAGETIGELAELGIETIVTDHHEPPDGPLPPAVAIVNPKLAGSTYPFRELCGSGVAFKLAWGLCQRISGARRVRQDLRDFLVEAMAYVAMATVCDVVPLIDENRVLALRGLVALRHARGAGLRALLKVCELSDRPLTAEDVGFKLGPRINASGRLGSAESAVELLLCDDDEKARALALELDRLNQTRRQIEAELCKVAFEQADRHRDDAMFVLAGQGWHSGVVGIVASRLVDRFGKPALVIGLDGERGRGSARSICGFDVLEAMRAGAEYFERFGGHEQAAGCEVRSEHVDALRAALVERAAEMLATRATSERSLWIDGHLPFQHMNSELMRQIDRLEPFGQDNEKPVLYSDDVRLAEPPRVVGADASHLLLRVRRGEHVLKAMAFGMAARREELSMGTPLHLAYTPRWNVFRGETKLELQLHDFAVGEPPLPVAP